jgi:hypothetical protein
MGQGENTLLRLYLLISLNFKGVGTLSIGIGTKQRCSIIHLILPLRSVLLHFPFLSV